MTSQLLCDRVALGTWGLAGAASVGGRPVGYSHVTEDTFRAVLDLAWESGVRWIDVAPGYGGGLALTRLGRWQSDRGVRWQVAFKPGRPYDLDGPITDLRPESLRASVAAAADQLGPVAALLLKDPPSDAVTSGTVDRILDEWRRGYPGVAVGLASHDLDLVDHLLTRSGGVEGLLLQIEFNLVNRQVVAPLASAATRAGARVWGMQPLAYGFLGGRVDASTTHPADDWRTRMPDNVRTVLASAARLSTSVATQTLAGLRHPQLALTWCLAAPDVERVIVGPRSVDQFRDVVTAAARAADPEVRADVAARLNALAQRSVIGRGSAH
jgi:aryl-alcohol dehydrogenase-like predicted oxidoreductase